MFKQTKRVLIAGIPFFSSDSNKDPYTITEEKIQQRLKEFEKLYPASGWERVKFGFFHLDEDGSHSPYFATVLQCTLVSGFAGIMYGGYRKSQSAYLDYIRTNQATSYLTANEAKKALQDRIFLSFFRGGTQLGWRTALFSFMFMTITNSIALYRNREGALEYSVGGAIAGSTYRIHVGIRGMIVGGILGLTLGTLAGSLLYAVHFLTGYSITDLRNSQYYFAVYRESANKRMDDLGARENEDSSELMELIIQDENAGRIGDDLSQIEKMPKVKNISETKVSEAQK